MPDERRPPHKTFAGLMLRAHDDIYGWLVSFDGEVFFRAPEMPRLGNVERMEAHVADKLGSLVRRYFDLHGIEVVTVVSNRRRDATATNREAL